ncbi:uncharacterized protein [Rutidosis leptorrhynchoides]|uniref:uncharacterized protein n=1 Tax=Rutidosis leptorrhynchoides TaxID=125765 RepID=UPI003A9988EC
MQFLLTTLKLVYVLSFPRPAESDDETMEHAWLRSKWDNDDLMCRGHILNGMSDVLFDVYNSSKSAKELWDKLEAKYMAEDASSKKFLVSNFNNYKIVDTRPIMKQFHEILRILGKFNQHNISVNETFTVSSIIDKLSSSWQDFKHTLKHKKEDMNLNELGSHLRIEESIWAQDSGKGKGKEDDTIGWWVDSGATCHTCKDREWFKTFVPEKDVLHMGNEFIASVVGYGNVVLEFSS